MPWVLGRFGSDCFVAKRVGGIVPKFVVAIRVQEYSRVPDRGELVLDIPNDGFDHPGLA